MKKQKKKHVSAKRIKVNCVQCNNCGDIIYSRAQHDLHHCRCGRTGVDGGFEYMRVIWPSGSVPKSIKKYIIANRTQLYHDWAMHFEDFGNWSKEHEKTKRKSKTKTTA